MFALVPRIWMIAEIEPRPAIEPARLHPADVVRHEVFAQIISFVGAHPKLIRAGAERDSDGVADSPRKNAPPIAVRIELEDARAIGFSRGIGYVRIRAD